MDYSEIILLPTSVPRTSEYKRLVGPFKDRFTLISRNNGSETIGDDEPLTELEYLCCLKNYYVGAAIFGDDEALVLWSISSGKKYLFLEEIVVRRDCQGKGISKVVHQYLKEQCLKYGAGPIIRARCDSDIQVRKFLACGFRITKDKVDKRGSHVRYLELRFDPNTLETIRPAPPIQGELDFSS